MRENGKANWSPICPCMCCKPNGTKAIVTGKKFSTTFIRNENMNKIRLVSIIRLELYVYADVKI